MLLTMTYVYCYALHTLQKSKIYEWVGAKLDLNDYLVSLPKILPAGSKLEQNQSIQNRVSHFKIFSNSKIGKVFFVTAS